MPAAVEQEQHALRLALGNHQHLCALDVLHPTLPELAIGGMCEAGAVCSPC